MKFLVFFAFVAFVVVQVACNEEFKCEPGTPYIENECNSCFCTERRELGCTLMACINPKQAELYNCEVGTTSVKGSNKCWCVKDLGTICTNHK